MNETIRVEVGNTATANIKLQLGQESQVIEVQASTVAVNTEQAEVQGVLNSDQIANLPVNGRNFLDLAQLEPGVQIQDGQNFDPDQSRLLFDLIRRTFRPNRPHQRGRC